MKALSVQQPWAWLITNGFKDVENRTWATHFRGKCLIHAGKQVDTSSLKELRESFPDIPFPDVFATGGIVGETYIADCVTDLDSIWFSGPYGFVCQNSQVLPFRPMRGQLGFFDVPPDPSTATAGEREEAP